MSKYQLFIESIGVSGSVGRDLSFHIVSAVCDKKVGGNPKHRSLTEKLPFIDPLSLGLSISVVERDQGYSDSGGGAGSITISPIVPQSTASVTIKVKEDYGPNPKPKRPAREATFTLEFLAIVTPDPLTAKEKARLAADKFRKEVIKRMLDDLSRLSGKPLGGDAAEELLLGTALHESDGLTKREQTNGPALGLFGMEPKTYDDLWRYLTNQQPTLADAIRQEFGLGQETPDATRLKTDDAYAAAMARVKYYVDPSALPPAGDLPAQAQYWGAHYQTGNSSKRIAKYEADWNRVYGP